MEPPQPHSQNPEHPKPQTWLFSNVELEETDIKLVRKVINPFHQLKIMRIVKEIPLHVGPWPNGLHPIMISYEDMKDYAIINGTWEHSPLPMDEEQYVSIRALHPMPQPKCEDSRRFVENLEEIAEMKLKKNASNAEIAKMFRIDTWSVPWLIDLYINETEEKKKRIMDKLKRKLN